MKTLRTIISTLVMTVMVMNTVSFAQMSPYKFKQQFDVAFGNILEGNYGDAIPVLEKLHLSDGEHGQVAFLLAMCHVKTDEISSETVKLLNLASQNFSYYHQRGLVTDKSAPAKAWFYLAQALAETQQSKLAITAYRNYMSCVPLASLDHKRTVVYAIRELRQKLENPRSVMSSAIASSEL